jgi:hypothetical protein
LFAHPLITVELAVYFNLPWNFGAETDSPPKRQEAVAELEKQTAAIGLVQKMKVERAPGCPFNLTPSAAARLNKNAIGVKSASA